MFPLTVDELRKSVEYPTGNDANDALQLLLDASEESIVKRAGASGAVTEIIDGGWSTLILYRPIASVTSVTEDIYGTPLVLSADDYRYSVGGYVLHRLSNGTNPGSIWRGPVSVVSTSTDDTSSRELAQIALVRLFLSHHPGLVSQQIGDWSESFTTGDYAYTKAMEEILSALDAEPALVVIG